MNMPLTWHRSVFTAKAKLRFKLTTITFGYLVLLTFASAETYYILPTPNTTCPNDVTCLTLTQYAQKTLETAFITLTFAPGNHYLSPESDLKIVNITNLILQAEYQNSSSFPVATVTCNRSGFVFEGISDVAMSGLEFNECVNNTVSSVDQFRLESCRFRTGHGIELERIKNATIERSSFVSLTGRETEVSRYQTTNTSTWTETSTAGGAIVTRNSTVVINECQFDENTADDGGSIYSTDSVIEINMSNFSNNTVNYYGGSIYSNIGTTITIQHSNFVNNRAYNESDNDSNGVPYSLGGATAAFYSTMVISECHFKGNIAEFGGSVYSYVSNTKINRSSFTHSTAYTGGGAIHTYNGTNLTIQESTFINNTAHKVGGAITTRTSDIEIHNSDFTNNTALEFGGSIYSWYYTNFKINRSNFTHSTALYYGGAIRAYNGINLTIHESMFINNTAHSYGGAIAAYRSGIQLLVEIHNSKFTNNTGAIHSHNGNIIINQSTFFSNSGNAKSAVSSNLTRRGLLLTGNEADSTGIIFAIDSSLSFSGNTTISNNHRSLYAFSSNVTFDGYTSITNNVIHGPDIQEGGALTCFQSDISFRGEVIISGNQVVNGTGGAIFSRESNIYTFGDTTIANNTALSGGGIYAYQSELNFKGKTNIRDNTATEKGGGIYAIATSIKLLGGQLQFNENTAERGGGVCLESNAKLYVIKTERECFEYKRKECFSNYQDRTRWLRLQLTNNSADYGGALYVSDNTNSGNCAANTDQSTSSECFLQGLALHSQSGDVLNVHNINFTGNSATKSGGIIFGGLLDRCTVSTYAEVFNRYQHLSPSSLNATSYLMEITDLTANDIQTEISSEQVRVCICRKGQPDCSYSPPPYQVKKGQTFKVSLVAVDQVNNPVPSLVRAFLSSNDGGLGEGQVIQSTTSNCTELNYTVSSPRNSEQLNLYAEGPCNDIGISQKQLHVEFLPCNCPVGFNVSEEQSNCVCDCDPEIYPEHITSCSIETESVQRKDNKWISYINTSDQEGYLIHLHCPFDYCRPSTDKVWINLNVPNGAGAQCAFNRSGKLCGSCEKGLSLSLGSSRCMPCSSNWLALFIVFAIAGVALVAFLLVCNLTVAVGTINGLIFYANILTINRATFFPFETHNLFTVFIAWLNLDFGFVTCFYDGMDGYVKEWLQLVFPIYIIFMVATVIIACEYSTRIAKVFTKTHPVATLATLILLSYTKSLRVIIAALSSTTLEYPDGSHELVWLADANIQYFEGKHIPLFLVALLILLVGIVYTLFLFFYQWLLHCSHNRALDWISSARFYPFMDAYHAPFSKKYRYWTGLLLFVRAFLYVGVSLNVSGNPSVNLLLIGCTLLALCLFKMIMIRKFYKSWPLETLENSFIFNLLVFSFATLYIKETGGNQPALAYISTSIAFITFLIILLYHTYAFVLPKKVKNKLDSIKCKAPTKEDDIIPAQENQCTYSVVDPIPPPPKTLAEVEARCKAKLMKEEKPELKCPSLENESNNPSLVSSKEASQNTAPTSGQKIECQVDIELRNITAARNGTDSKDEQNSKANGKDCECNSQSAKIFVEPYIVDIDQRGMERETEINDFIKTIK